MTRRPPRRPTRRGAALALVTGVAALLLAACGTSQAALPPNITHPVTIRIAAFKGPETSALFRIIPEWEHITGNHVELGVVDPQTGKRIVPSDYDTYQAAVISNAKQQSGNYDVVILDDPWMPFMAGNGHLLPLTPFGYESPPDIVTRSATLGVWPPPFGPQPPDAVNVARGRETYAIPLVGNVLMLWYRADEIAPPKTLNQLITNLQHPIPGFTGKVGLAPSRDPHLLMTWLAERGVDLFDRDWRPTPLRTPLAASAAGEYLREATSLGVPYEQYAPELYTPEARMLDGTASASIAWAAAAQELLTSSVSDQIKVIQLPPGQRETALTGNWLLGIPSDAKQAAAAYDFIVWATSQDIMKTSALLGVPPVRKSLFTDRELDSKYPWLPDVEQALETSFARPRIPGWGVIEGVLSCSLDTALKQAGQVPSDQRSSLAPFEAIASSALDTAANRIETIMAGWGYYQPSSYWTSDPSRHVPGDPTQSYQCPEEPNG